MLAADCSSISLIPLKAAAISSMFSCDRASLGGLRRVSLPCAFMVAGLLVFLTLVEDSPEANPLKFCLWQNFLYRSFLLSVFFWARLSPLALPLFCQFWLVVFLTLILFSFLYG